MSGEGIQAGLHCWRDHFSHRESDLHEPHCQPARNAAEDRGIRARRSILLRREKYGAIHQFVANELCTCFKNHSLPEGGTLIRYPSDIGITGTVFREEKAAASLRGKREKNFHQIDNSGSYSEIRNFLFVPMYGLNGTKTGVVQFFNKSRGTPTESDLETVRPYQRLAGVLLQNMVEMNTAIDVSMNMRTVLESLARKTSSDETQGLEYQFGMNKVQQRLLKIGEIVSEKLEKRVVAFQNAISPSKKDAS